MVSVQNLRVSFGDRTVLDGINLDVAEGEILAIMGSSGGGKTTLLRAISGLLVPSEGEVVVDGVSVLEQPEEARRRMGMVFQSAALFDFMSVDQNVRFGLERRLAPAERRDIVKRASEGLAEVGLSDEGAKFPSELSGGMRKRVGIARALVLHPKVMLYDEPTTGLDPLTTYTIDTLIVKLRKQFSMTSLLVSHDVHSVFRTCDRIAFLHAGKLIFQGTSEEMRQSQEPPIIELLEKSQSDVLLV